MGNGHYIGPPVCRQRPAVCLTSMPVQCKGCEGCLLLHHTCAVSVPPVGVFALDMDTAQVMADFSHQHVTSVRNDSESHICTFTSLRWRRYKHVHAHADQCALTIFKTVPPPSQSKHLHNPSYTGHPPFAVACEIFVSIDLISSQG